VGIEKEVHGDGPAAAGKLKGGQVYGGVAAIATKLRSWPNVMDLFKLLRRH
jgi:hypothetical protein